MTGLDIEPKFGTAIATVADDGNLRLWDPMSRTSLVPADTDTPNKVNNKEAKLMKGLTDTSSCCFSEDGTGLVISGLASEVATIHSLHLNVPRLKHLCRLVVRKTVHKTKSLSKLPIPTPLVSYLAYQVWL